MFVRTISISHKVLVAKSTRCLGNNNEITESELSFKFTSIKMEETFLHHISYQKTIKDVKSDT